MTEPMISNLSTVEQMINVRVYLHNCYCDEVRNYVM